MDAGEKLKQLTELGRERREKKKDYPGYFDVSDFYQGKYDSDFVTPITKSACNVDSSIVFVFQDWSDCDRLDKGFNRLMAERGYAPDTPMHQNLKASLRRTYSLEYADVYITNLFPYIKHHHGEVIPRALLDRAFDDFCWKEINIVDPKFVVCLGSEVFMTFGRKLRHKQYLDDNCFTNENLTIYGLSHPAHEMSDDEREAEWEDMKEVIDLASRGKQ